MRFASEVLGTEGRVGSSLEMDARLFLLLVREWERGSSEAKEV